MSTEQIVLLIELFLILSFLLYFFYIKKNTSILVGILTIFLWFLNFSLVILLPFDIYFNKKGKALGVGDDVIEANMRTEANSRKKINLRAQLKVTLCSMLSLELLL